jgi:hypothetical protein
MAVKLSDVHLRRNRKMLGQAFLNYETDQFRCLRCCIAYILANISKDSVIDDVYSFLTLFNHHSFMISKSNPGSAEPSQDGKDNSGGLMTLTRHICTRHLI